MDWKLEAVVVPVSDVERSRAFYVDQLGFRLDTDHQGGPDFRVIQVTPPGSACSIIFGKGMGDGEPGSVKGNQLVVDDIEAAADQLSAAGVEHSGAQHFEAGSDGARTGSRPRVVRLVHLLLRPGRQHLGRAGDQGTRALT